MHTTNYRSTLIAVAPDTTAATGVVPSKPGTVAALQYEIMSSAPYRYTSDDVLFLVHARRTGTEPTDDARAAFFAKPQACLRASPLVRSHGFGIHHDEQGRIVLVAMDCAAYAGLLESPTVKVVHGLRKTRT